MLSKYKIVFIALGVFACPGLNAQIESEPNNTIDQANEIDLESTGMMSGTIGTECANGSNSDDYFFVEVFDNGSLTLEITASNTGLNNSWHQITFQNFEGTNYAVKFFESGGENSMISTVVNACLPAGVNYLKFSLTDMGMCADYSITASFSPAVYGEDDEPNDSQSEAQMIYFGEPATGQLGFGLDTSLDYFAVNADSDGNFSMDIMSEIGYALQFPETLTVALTDPIGTPLLYGAPTLGEESEPLSFTYSYGGLEPNGLYFIIVGSNACGASYAINYPSANPIGLPDERNQVFSVSPNPSSDMFRFSGKDIESVMIRDSRGKFVENIIGEHVDYLEWNASEISDGIYYVEIRNSLGFSTTVKLVKTD